MKKLLLLMVNVTFVLLLIACTEYEMSYSFTPTEHVLGASVCYVEGTDVRLTPVIDLGYTTETERSDGDSGDYYYYHWLLKEINYSLKLEDEGTYTSVKDESITTDYSEDAYINAIFYDMYDYYPLYDGEDPFNFGPLPAGNYQFSFTTISRYMNYTNTTSTGDSIQDTSKGMETHELTSTIDFTVSSYCGEIEDGYILLLQQDDEDDDLNYQFFIKGFDQDGSKLTPSDIIIIDLMMANEPDYFYQDAEYTLLSPLDDFQYVYLTAEYYYNGEYENYSGYDDSIDFADKYGSEYYDILNFPQLYFDLNYFNGYNLAYIREYEYGKDDMYITINIKGTNIYKDIKVIYEQDVTDPEFGNLPEDQIINEGEELDLLDLGLTAEDNLDGDITDQITVDITDTSVLLAGEHEVTYTITDFFGNTSTTQITLTVLSNDFEEPVITINNALPTTFEVGDVLPDFTSYFTAIDDRDGSIDITQSMLSWSPEFDINTPGTYNLTITVADKAMNEATETIVITILAPDLSPIFNNIPTDQTITEGQALDLLGLGLTASDVEDGDLTSTITVDIIDTTLLTLGDHTATYSVTDSYGHTVTVTITITVIESTSPYSGAVFMAIALEPFVIDVAFDVEMLDNLFADPNAFVVVVDGITATTTDAAISIDGLSVTLTIDEIISLGSIVTVSYQRTGTDDLMHGNTLLPEFQDVYVDTNNMNSGGGDLTGGVMFAVAFNANTIEIIFDVDTFDNSFLDETAFTVTINGVATTITGSFVNINAVTLYISGTMNEFTLVEVSYQATGNSDLSYGGVLIPDFSNVIVLPPNSGSMGPF